MSVEEKKHIFFRSIEIIINSAKSIILDEWDGEFYKFSKNDLAEEFTCKELTSEFLLEPDCCAKIYLSADKKTINYLSMKLYGMELFEEDEEMMQDGLNEILNYFIGNAARELENLGLDFVESLIPKAAEFEEEKKSYENYISKIPTDSGEVIFIFSTKN